MKFGFRTPSLTKRIAARTSIKRQIVHRIGLKMPRGFGWFRDPKKAAYNAVYNRVTVDPLSEISKAASSPSVSTELAKAVAKGVVLAAIGALIAGIVAALSGAGRRK